MINNGMSWLSLGNYINPKTRNTELSNDYNQLSNKPIITLTGTSQNPIKLWKLDVGLYILNGYVQHTDALLSEARGLFVSATVGIVNGKYVISAFIPFWEGQYEYILPSLSSETYTEHQMIRMITQGNSLTLDNIREYFPTQDYHPTTKKYVDETMDAIRNELNKMGLNNNDVQSLIKENRRRDIAIQALLSQNSDKMVTIDEEVHNISMDYSLDNGIATINTLEGDTLVNVSKDTEYDKVLSYEQDIVENTNTVDLEIDGNLNPIIVGDTLVNVCTQNNPTAITNEYTVEGNNHFALQDEVEGNCRPIIQGNTIVNRSKTKDITPLTTYVSEVEGNEMSLVDDTDTHVRIDKLVGDTMVNLWREENVITSYRAVLENHRIKCTTDTNRYHNFFIDDISMIKPSTTYTCIVNIYKNTLNNTVSEGVWIFSKNIIGGEYDIYTQNGSNGWCIEGGEVGQFKLTFTTPTEITATRLIRSFIANESQIEGQEVELDVMLLEGDYTNKPIPQEYFEGLKNSYEDGYIPSDIWCNYHKGTINNSNVISTITSEHSFEYKAQGSFSGNISPANMIKINGLNPNTTYTIGFKTNANCIMNMLHENNVEDQYSTTMGTNHSFTPNIFSMYSFTTPAVFTASHIRLMSIDDSVRSITFSDIILLEGDYTSNPSTYEEVMEHGGKYRCKVEVQGKNLFDGKFIDGYIEDAIGEVTIASVYGKSSANFIKVDSDTQYTITVNCPIYSIISVYWYDVNQNYIKFTGTNTTTLLTFTTPSNCEYLKFRLYSPEGNFTLNSTEGITVQVEKGAVATAYEPYYNQTQTVYLNSPLLKGDEVVYKEGKLCHYHKMGKVVLDGSENWRFCVDILNTDTHSSLYFLKEDCVISGVILSDNFPSVNKYITYGYADCIGIGVSNEKPIIAISISKSKLSTIDVNNFTQWLSENPTTVVYELANPYYETISTSELLLPITTNCKLLTSSNIPLTTMSTRVFTEEVNILANTQYSLNFNSDVASTVNITLGETVLSNQAIVKGYNRFSITTPSTLVDDLLIIEGSGVNISEVVITEYDEGVCEYIEGLKSSFEDGRLPSKNDNLIDIPNIYLENSKQVVHIKNVQNYLSKGKLYTISYIISKDTLNMDGALFRLGPDSYNYISIVTTYKIGRNTVSFKMPYDTYCYFEFWNRDKGVINISDIIILEGDWTHLTEEDWNHLEQYKVEYKVTGKNKVNTIDSLKEWDGAKIHFKNAQIDFIPNSNNSLPLEYENPLNYNLKKGVTYTLSTKQLSGGAFSSGSMGVGIRIYYTDGTNSIINIDNTNNNYNNIKSKTFTTKTNKEVKKVALRAIGYNIGYTATANVYSYALQIEEGTVATEYEPYKESIQTVYLNSPLLEGDTIEEIDGEVYHVHRYGKVVFDGSNDEKLEYSKSFDRGVFLDLISSSYFYSNYKITDNTWNATQRYCLKNASSYGIYSLNDFKQWLSENPITVVYKLATPTYELIPSSSIVCKSYPNGHLDFDTNVHINNTVNFVKANLPITYANTSTNYKLQFVSDKDMENVTINALGNIMENVTITKGLNKISFTSPSDATNILTFEGIGRAYISNVQLVATEKDIDYFKGLYSTYECGLIEDESNENYGKYEVNIVSYNAPIQFGKGGKIE